MAGPNRCYIMALGIVDQIHKTEEGRKLEQELDERRKLEKELEQVIAHIMEDKRGLERPGWVACVLHALLL